jgi:hypothetical protein
MSADVLLARLERVRRVGTRRWSARCPTRDDKSPSLSIRELDDGRILIHDFGGDDVQAILEAVGLTFTDLYPKRLEGHPPVRRPFNADDVLHLAEREAFVATIVIADFLRDGVVSDADHQRLITAGLRLADAVEVCRAR